MKRAASRPIKTGIAVAVLVPSTFLVARGFGEWARASTSFMPHGYCYLWNPGIVWLHVVSDALIALSYYCIPAALVYLVHKRRDLPFNWIFWMFGLFILGCGTTHLIEIWTIWHAWYLLSGIVKAMTAGVSVLTAAMLIPLLPKAIALPSREQMDGVNHELQVRVAEREQAERQLRETLAEREQTLTELAAHKSAVEELQLTQTAVRESQDRLNAIIQSAMDAILTIDEEHRIVLFNAAAEKMFGCEASQALGGSVERFIPERFRGIHASHIRRFGETGTTSRAMGTLGTIWGRRASGEEFPLEASISQVASGSKKLFTVILRDITERKRAEEALNESLGARELALRDLADQKFALDQHAIVATTDVHGTITYVNDKFCAISKYSREELLGQNHRILNSGHHPREFFVDMYQTIAHGRVWHGEICNRAKDGSIYWVETTIVPFLNANGKPRQYTALRTDVTERKRMEEARSHLAAVVESSDDAIVAKTLEGTITAWNAGAEKLYGYSAADALGKSMRMLLPPERAGEETDILAQVGLGESVRHFDTVRLRKDGRRVDVSVTISPVRNAHGTIVGASNIARDISERKRSEAQLAAQAEELSRKAQELARSNADLEQFASVASHDLQEPLRMVTAYTQLLSERYSGKIDETANKFIGYAQDGAIRMQVLIQDLLAFSRVGRKEDARTQVDCNQVMEDVRQVLASAIEESAAVITCSNLPTVLADRTQIIQLFQNLIGNAIKFRGSKPPVISVRAEKDGQNWLFSVKDNGIGIAPEYGENIFVIFQRLHARTEYPGNGIGLAICKKIVERYGGKIWVESKPEAGSTFRFVMPVRAPEKAQATYA